MRSSIRYHVLTTPFKVKASLLPFLNAERIGASAPPPAREANVMFFILSTRTLVEAIANLDTQEETRADTILAHQAPLDREEIVQARTDLLLDPEYVNIVRRLAIPDALIMPQARPFGSDNQDPADRRVFSLLYHRNPVSDHPDSNHYGFPLPVVLFWDTWEKKFTAIHWYTGSEADGMTLGTTACHSA
jgi:primary-amine oxidase